MRSRLGIRGYDTEFAFKECNGCAVRVVDRFNGCFRAAARWSKHKARDVAHSSHRSALDFNGQGETQVVGIGIAKCGYTLIWRHRPGGSNRGHVKSTIPAHHRRRR